MKADTKRPTGSRCVTMSLSAWYNMAAVGRALMTTGECTTRRSRLHSPNFCHCLNDSSTVPLAVFGTRTRSTIGVTGGGGAGVSGGGAGASGDRAGGSGDGAGASGGWAVGRAGAFAGCAGAASSKILIMKAELMSALLNQSERRTVRIFLTEQSGRTGRSTLRTDRSSRAGPAGGVAQRLVLTLAVPTPK